MDQDNPHPKQFTRDDVARISASTVNAVLAKLSVQQIVDGIAVLPLGEGVWLVDVVIRDLTAHDTWAVSLTIPPGEEETSDALAESKTYAVLSISRRYLSSLGLTTQQLNRLTDADMQRIAAILQAQRFDHEFDEEVAFTARLVLAEKEQ